MIVKSYTFHIQCLASLPLPIHAFTAEPQQVRYQLPDTIVNIAAKVKNDMKGKERGYIQESTWED